MVLAFAGDSTMTSLFATHFSCERLALRLAAQLTLRM
jgi:hypothetical protein